MIIKRKKLLSNSYLMDSDWLLKTMNTITPASCGSKVLLDLD